MAGSTWKLRIIKYVAITLINRGHLSFEHQLTIIPSNQAAT